MKKRFIFIFITAAGSSSEERESGNFTFKSRIADLNTSGPGAKVSKHYS